jgi:hypothetical protein
MSGHSHDPEPVRGLPERLPQGETMLWQGAPDWKAFASQLFHIRMLAVYFAVLVAWNLFSDISAGAAGLTVLLTTLKLTGCAIGALVVLVAFSWAACKTTVYTITDRRVVIRSGIAFPATVNIPFKFIETAGLKTYKDGSGNILLTVSPSERLAYLLLWPHALPWRINRAQPLLRALPEPAFAAELLALALTAAPAAEARRPTISLVADNPVRPPDFALGMPANGRRSRDRVKSALRRSAERLDPTAAPSPVAGA